MTHENNVALVDKVSVHMNVLKILNFVLKLIFSLEEFEISEGSTE